MFKLSTLPSFPLTLKGDLAEAKYGFTGEIPFLRQDQIEKLTQQLAKRQRSLEIEQDDKNL